MVPAAGELDVIEAGKAHLGAAHRPGAEMIEDDVCPAQSGRPAPEDHGEVDGELVCGDGSHDKRSGDDPELTGIQYGRSAAGSDRDAPDCDLPLESVGGTPTDRQTLRLEVSHCFTVPVGVSLFYKVTQLFSDSRWKRFSTFETRQFWMAEVPAVRTTGSQHLAPFLSHCPSRCLTILEGDSVIF